MRDWQAGGAMTDPETAVRLSETRRLLALADKHEEMALGFAQHFDAGSVAKAAAHFTVATALRGRITPRPRPLRVADRD